MKVLYVNRPKFDYLQDFVFTGLVKSIGMKNIIEHPWNPKYHLNFKQYPKNVGAVKEGFIQSILNRNKKDYDVVIVASCHPDTIKSYEELLPEIPDSVPRVFIDGGDWPEVGGDFDRLGGRDVYNEVVKKRPFDHIFKREFLVDKDYPKNVYPLPMCFNPDRIPLDRNESKKYDVSFWAVESHPIRTKALDLIENEFDCKSNGTEKSQVMSKYKRKGEFYLQEIMACKIVLNFRGAGWDTLRYWEVPAVSGFMVSQKPGIVIPNNFEHGKDAVFCKDDLSDLVELCEYYLKNEKERDKIALAGHNTLIKYHTDQKRVEFLMSKVEGSLST